MGINIIIKLFIDFSSFRVLHLKQKKNDKKYSTEENIKPWYACFESFGLSTLANTSITSFKAFFFKEIEYWARWHYHGRSLDTNCPDTFPKGKGWCRNPKGKIKSALTSSFPVNHTASKKTGQLVCLVFWVPFKFLFCIPGSECLCNLWAWCLRLRSNFAKHHYDSNVVG